MNKRLYLYFFLILIWCNVSNAGSIKDNQKGGLKLGGSLLDLMYEEEIKDNFYPITKGDKFTSVMYIPNVFTYPEEIGLYLVIVKPNDKNYTIHGFYLFEDFPNDFEGCIKKQDEYMKIKLKTNTNNRTKTIQTPKKNTTKTKKSSRIKVIRWLALDFTP